MNTYRTLRSTPSSKQEKEVIASTHRTAAEQVAHGQLTEVNDTGDYVAYRDSHNNALIVVSRIRL